ncbi:MAG: hypothetical protein NWE89_11440 [Candidatus Bathyarchaeota archaeon]|nr:hypothetical protein [Candidatus Bathyarchaeota archaeon]
MNYRSVTKALRVSRRSWIERKKIREYHNEITFLVKALFFVYLGMVVNLSVDSFITGVGVSVRIMVIRFIVVSVVGRLQGFTDIEVAVTRMVFIRGTGTLVFSQFPSKYDSLGLVFTNPDMFTDLVVPIVLMSILFSSFLAPLVGRKGVEASVSETLEDSETPEIEENGDGLIEKWE